MNKNPKPWRIALPALGFAVIGALWSGFWYWSQTNAHQRIDQWRAELAAKDIKIQCGQETWGGFPFRIEVRCSPGHIEKNGEGITFTELTIMAQIYNPKHVLAVNDGQTILATKQGEHIFTHEGAIGSLILTENGHLQADVSFTKLASEHLTATSFELHSRKRNEVMEIAASIQEARLYDHDIDAEIIGAISPMPSGMRLSDFAAAQSTLTIDHLRMGLDGAEFNGNGNGSLLQDGKPDARLSGRIQNLQAIIEKLLDARLLQPDQAQGAQFLFGLMGANSEKGMKIDLVARDGWLWLGPLKVTKIDPLF